MLTILACKGRTSLSSTLILFKFLCYEVPVFFKLIKLFDLNTLDYIHQ